jgi:hypothetical protein
MRRTRLLGIKMSRKRLCKPPSCTHIEHRQERHV